MISVISDEQKIQKLHHKFLEAFSALITDEIKCWVGFPGGSVEGLVRYSEKLNLWILSQNLETRIWNGFGIGKPSINKSNSIVGEINFPYQSINRRVAGVFANENKTGTLVLHRGIIGGGRRGVGKNYFLNNFRGDFVLAIDGDRETKFCLVGELNSEFFPSQVSTFIHEIYRVKHNLQEDEFSNHDNIINFEYTEEQSGLSVTENNEPREINRIHGIIVSALADALKKRGYKVGNDKNRDLFIHNGNDVKVLFEVKSNSSTQSLCSAVGQLLVYSIPLNKSVKLFAVLPNQLSAKVEHRLNSLGIEILYYDWSNNQPIFTDLNTHI